MMQGLFLKIFHIDIGMFSMVINQDMNGKKYLCNRIGNFVLSEAYQVA